jgi:hypothetical protein
MSDDPTLGAAKLAAATTPPGIRAAALVAWPY